jgi:type IV secretion system protein VirB10
MLATGAGLLGWYYTHAALRPVRARESARKAAIKSAQGDMILPPLEHPLPMRPTDVPGVEVAPASPILLPDASTTVSTDMVRTTPRPTVVVASRGDRRLAGPVYAEAAAGSGGQSPAAASASGSFEGISGPAAIQPGPIAAASGTAEGSSLSTLLRSEPTNALHASVLTGQRWLLPMGAFIDCTLETAIDSTLPGMTTCVTATDTFGADGKVVLLERGTKLVGETRGQVQQGSARVFVIWTQARTPTGVVVPLESPGTDELGRSGLTGAVDRHFWDRFGAAILISTIDGAVQAAVDSGARSGGTTIINPASVQDVTTETLKSTLNIPPTVIKHNGDRVEILVAHDVDFSGVYELRAASHDR